MKLTMWAPRRAMMLLMLCAALFYPRNGAGQLRFPYETNGPTGAPPNLGPGPIDFSADGRYLAMPSAGNRVMLWDLREGARWGTFGHAAGQRPKATLWARDGRTLAALFTGDSRGAELVFYDVQSRSQRASIPFDHLDGPRAMAMSPDGAELVMVIPRGKGRSVSCEVKVWNVATAEPLRSVDAAPDCSDVEYSPDGKWLATVHGISDDKGQIILWDAETFERRHVLRAGGGRLSLAFSPDSKLIAAGVNHRKRRKLVGFVVRAWDVSSGKEAGLAEIDVGGDHNSCTVLPLFSPDSPTLVVMCSGGGGPETHFELWNVASGEQRLLTRGDSGRWINPIHNRADFSPDGRVLATTATDRRPEVVLWDTKYWTVVRTLDMSATGESGSRGSSIDCVRISPDSKWLAALRTDFATRANVHHKEVLLWNLAEMLDAPSDSLAPKLDR